MPLVQMAKYSTENIFILFLIKGFFFCFQCKHNHKEKFKELIARYALRKTHYVFHSLSSYEFSVEDKYTHTNTSDVKVYSQAVI